MTKEEIKKEAEDYADDKKHFDRQAQLYIVDGYLAGAEPREKRISDLETINKKISNECHKLVGSLEKKQNENVELIGKVAFLENDLNNAKAQIEKMKCCENCGWYYLQQHWRESEEINEKGTSWAHRKSLERENRKLKDQLTKAKNLLAKWVELFKPKVGKIPPTPIQVETEQFLNSEVEK